MRAPEAAGAGTADVTVSFDAWEAGPVAPTHHEIPVVVPRPSPKPEPVSARLKGELIHPDQSAWLVGLRFSPDGKHLIGGDYPGGVVVVWDIATGKQRTIIETGYGRRRTIAYFFLTPDWQTLFVSWGKRQYEWVEQNGKRLLRWNCDGGVRTWDLATGQPRRTYQHQPPRAIDLMLLSPDGTRFLTFEELSGTHEGSPKRAVSLWDTATGCYQPLPDNLETDGIFSPDGQTLAIVAVDAAYHATALKLLDPATGHEKFAIPIPDRNASACLVAFSPDSRLMVGDYSVYERPNKRDKSQSWLKWWDTASGREVASFAADNDLFFLPHFSPDGQTLAATNRRGQQAKLFLFRVPDSQLFKTLVWEEKTEGQRVSAGQTAFSPDGKWLALATHVVPDKPSADQDEHELPQPRIHLIEVATGTIRETWIAPPGGGGIRCFSPDGRTLATAGRGRVFLWDLT